MTLHSSQTSPPGLTGIHSQWVDALAHYGASPSAHDELLNEGEVRAHWLPLLRQPLEDARAAPGAADGSPALRRDALPFLIAAEEWRSIEAGLEQRARLLNAINLDFYGEQRLLRERGFPPALAFANRRYLPACRPGFSTSVGTLGLLAFDLARAADGGWRVLASRTEAPTGLGLALDSRIHAASALADAAQEAGLASLHEVLEGFSAAVRQRGQATGTPSNSLCVLLAEDATHSDHADWVALSEHLGFPLLEGNDLAVRGGAVFAKTLGGLKPVAAVLRLVESDGCDPLTLSPTSLVGTPGLLNAATQKRVSVINPIGSGAVDSEALTPFLPALCEILLDEPLLLPSPATWWCGQRREAAQVLERLDELAVGEAFGSPGGLDGDPMPAKPDPAAGAALRGAMQAQPYRYVAREPFCASTAPWLTSEGKLKPAPVTLRLFAAATPSGFRVLPGGLARTANGLGVLVKDVWIAETGPAQAHQAAGDDRPPPGMEPAGVGLAGTSSARLLRTAASPGAPKPRVADAPASGGADSAILTRRLGDDLFWLGRYLERAETSVRIFTTLGQRITHGRPLQLEAAQGLLQLLLTLGFTDPADERSAGALDEAGFCRLLLDTAGEDGLTNLLKRLRLTAVRRRGILPIAAWQAMEGIHQALQSRWRTRTLADALRLLDGLTLRLSAVGGLLDATQPQVQGYWLQRLGKHIERLRLLAAINIEFGVTPAPVDPNRLHLLLQLHNLAEAQATWAADPGTVWHRLVGDADHPRSMRHQAVRIDQCLERLSLQNSPASLAEARQCASALTDDLANACDSQEDGKGNQSQALLSSASARATEISALVSALWIQTQTA